MRIGQGHAGFSNNWWLGSSKCLGVPDSKELKCNGLPFFNCDVSFASGDDDHTFQVNEATRR
jgi:hypothetical protein